MKRRILFWVIIALFVVFVATRLSDLNELVRTLSTGAWQWVAVAVVAQIGYFVSVAGFYTVGMRMVGIRYRVRDMIPVVLGSIFVSGVTPAGEAGGFALFVDDARRRGNEPAAAAAGALLGQLGYYMGLAVSLVFGFSYLIAVGGLTPLAAFGGIAVFALSGGIVLVLVLGARRPDLLRRLLGRLQGLGDALAVRIVGKPLADKDWAPRTSEEFCRASGYFTGKPGTIALLMGVSLVSQLLDIITLAALFLTFGQQVSPGPVIATFSIAMALWSVLPFQGIGIVEATMSLVLTGFGIPGGTATVIALTFRGLTFWIPLGLGFLLLRRTSTFAVPETGPAERRTRTIRWAAFVTGVLGFIEMAAYNVKASPARIDLLGGVLPDWVPPLANVITGLLGAFLVLLSIGIWRRSPLALWRAVWVLAALTVTNLVRGLEWETAALTAGAAAWLASIGPSMLSRDGAPARAATAVEPEEHPWSD
jgi:uncharacterized protein (TIRG00374 family)